MAATSLFPPGSPVTHRVHAARGVGYVRGTHVERGVTKIEVQWPGLLLTRRELIGNVDPAPVNDPPRRGRRAA